MRNFPRKRTSQTRARTCDGSCPVYGNDPDRWRHSLMLRQLMARKLGSDESYQQMAENAAINGFNAYWVS